MSKACHRDLEGATPRDNPPSKGNHEQFEDPTAWILNQRAIEQYEILEREQRNERGE